MKKEASAMARRAARKVEPYFEMMDGRKVNYLDSLILAINWGFETLPDTVKATIIIIIRRSINVSQVVSLLFNQSFFEA